MTLRFLSIFLALVSIMPMRGADPMATAYTYDQCEGSLMPYPMDTKTVAYPDTLVPVMINHVGRHGARYPSSAQNSQILKRALEKAQSSGTITPLGKSLLKITNDIITISDGKWGALDSLGEYEQRMLASRMYTTFKPAFDSGKVNAISSYSPRAMMSMYCFTHQLDRLNNKIEFQTTTGRQNSELMRPFDLDEQFKEFLKSAVLTDTYQDYFQKNCPVTAIERVLGKNFSYQDADQKKNLAYAEYHVLSGLSAMAYKGCNMSDFFTVEEVNALWGCFNLKQYLQRTSSTLSSIPADIAAALLENLVQTTDDFIDGRTTTSVWLRFGHAETLLPLLSLMRLPGCYYMTNYFDTVAKNWKDFDIVPMAANLHLILFKNTKSGKYYVRLDLNEKPVAFILGSDSVYVPWLTAKKYLMRCLPY